MVADDSEEEAKRLEEFERLEADERLPQADLELTKSDHVALLLDGYGSKSKDRSLAALGQAVEPAYDPVLFSYRQVGKPYAPTDSLKTPDEVSSLIDAHFHYLEATKVCLLGYSLGGLGLAYWLTRNGLKQLSRIDRIVFVATPVWLIPVPRSNLLTLGRLLHEFSFDWPAFKSAVLPNVECLVLRCEFGKDGLFTYDEDWISFEARGIDLEDLHVQERAIPDVDHFNICQSPHTAAVLRDWIQGDSKGTPPRSR